jgi:copper homeostasis protein CutC
MLRDIELCRNIGVDGVVIGCLTADGDVDIPAMKRLLDAAKGMDVTFHRAFDMCRNPRKALEDIISLGCNRILTSGQRKPHHAACCFSGLTPLSLPFFRFKNSKYLLHFFVFLMIMIIIITVAT